MFILVYWLFTNNCSELILGILESCTETLLVHTLVSCRTSTVLEGVHLLKKEPYQRTWFVFCYEFCKFKFVSLVYFVYCYKWSLYWKPKYSTHFVSYTDLSGSRGREDENMRAGHILWRGQLALDGLLTKPFIRRELVRHESKASIRF